MFTLFIMKVAVCIAGACTLYYMMIHTYDKLFEALRRNNIDYDIYVCLCTYSQFSVPHTENEDELMKRFDVVRDCLKERYPDIIKDSDIYDCNNSRVFARQALVNFNLSPQQVKNHFIQMFGDKIKYLVVDNDDQVKNIFDRIMEKESRKVSSASFPPELKRYILVDKICEIEKTNNFKYSACISFRADSIFNYVTDQIVDIIKDVKRKGSVFNYQWPTSGVGSDEYPHTRTDYFMITPVDCATLLSKKIQVSNLLPTKGFVCLECFKYYKEFSHIRSYNYDVTCCGKPLLIKYSEIKLCLNPEIACRCSQCKRIYVQVTPEAAKTECVMRYKRDLHSGVFISSFTCCGVKPEYGVIHPEQKFRRRFIKKIDMIPMDGTIVNMDLHDSKRFWDMDKINPEFHKLITEKLNVLSYRQTV